MDMSVISSQDELKLSEADLEEKPNLESYLMRASALELGRRSLIGAPVYAVISLIMLLGTPISRDYGWVAAGEALLLIVLGVLRFRFAQSFERRYDRVGERAVIQFHILTALQSLTLGVVAAVVIWRYWGTQDAVLTIVLSAGCVAAATSALSVRRSVHVIFLLCVLMPFGLAVLIVGGLANALMIIGFLILMAFLVQDGGQAKRAYMKQLRDNYAAESSLRWSAAESAAKKAFLDDMTHEIRSPLNSITGMAALLLEQNLDKRPSEFAAIIHKSGVALTNLIQPMPPAVHANADDPEAGNAEFNLRDCIEEVMRLYRARADRRGVVLTSNLADLPEFVVFSDHNYIEQVLINLMGNAVEHTEGGSVTLGASCQDLGNGVMCIEFTITDTGEGISTSKLESIFTIDPISKAGLGLPMSKGLTELMGGGIWIETIEGEGTSVRFTIRVQVAPDDVSWRSASAMLAGLASGIETDLAQRFPHQILVVEDHSINRRVLCELLRTMGYHTDEATDGHEAVAAAMKSSYDIIFMDLRMPNMGGFEATRWIREHYNNRSLRIVALTAESTSEARDRCLTNGMDDFVPKPVQIKSLESILRNTPCHA